MSSRVNVLGTGITPLTMREAVDRIDRAVQVRSSEYVCVAAAHSVMACLADGSLRRIFNRSLITTPDGMSLVWLARRASKRPVERVYGPDLMLAVCSQSHSPGYRHFLYGGAPGVGDELASQLKNRYRWLDIVGVYSPPFRPLTSEEDAQVVELINDLAADVVWVGLGTGKQERWMAEHLGRISAPVMVGVGAAFDLLSGRKPQAPEWIQRVGLEWLFRLATEPRRLWRRYVEYPRFVLLVLAQLSGLKRFPLES